MVTRALLQYNCGPAFSEKFIIPDFLFTSKSLHEISIEMYNGQKISRGFFNVRVLYVVVFCAQAKHMELCAMHAVVLSMNVSFIANNAFTVFIDWRRVFYLKLGG